MAVTIKDIAKAAGVSTATVSHVINGTRFVSEEIKKKVNEVLQEKNYHPNLLARSLRSQKSKTIGLLLPDISSFYFTGVAEGIEKVLRKNGYHMLLSNSHDDIEIEKEMINVFNSQLIDGLIMAPVYGNHSYLQQTLNGQYPLVFIDRKPKGYNGDCVVLENIKSTYDATCILIDKGHKRIGLVLGFPSISTTEDRIAGYRQACHERGIAVDESLIKTGDFKYDSGFSITKELIENGQATALFCASDTMAIGALSYLREKGIKIPEQVAIISSNDFKWTQITNPPLTVVSQPSQELGEKAAELLILNIKHPGNKKKPKEIRLVSTIVLRGSC
jgi:LacI family transcriptional regulator